MVRYLDSTGRRRFHGGKKLKSTQTYTRRFSRLVAGLHKSVPLEKVLQDVARRRTEYAEGPWSEDCWLDANMAPVFDFVRRRLTTRHQAPTAKKKDKCTVCSVHLMRAMCVALQGQYQLGNRAGNAPNGAVPLQGVVH